MKIILVGATGFIGRHISSALFDYFPDTEYIGLSSAQYDLLCSKTSLAIGELFSPEAVVIWCAAIKKQLGDTLEIYHQNAVITKNLCNMLVGRKIRQLIYFSSAAVYGEDIHNLSITEQTHVQPRTYYGIGKHQSELLLRKIFVDHSIGELTILRPALTYGIGDVSKGYGPAGFLESVKQSKQINIWGDGSELREFVYVKDIAKLVCRLIDLNQSLTLNPASGHSYSYKQVLEHIFRLSERSVAVEQKDRTKQKVDHRFDNNLLRELFPDFSFTPLNAGLFEMIATSTKE